MKKYVCDVCGYIYDEAAGDRITVSRLAQNGKMFRKISFVRCAEWEKDQFSEVE